MAHPGPSSLYTQYDHLAPPLGADGTPNDFYMALRDEYVRENRPIGWSEQYGGFWAVAGYAEAREIWRNSDYFSNAGVTFPRYSTNETIMLAGQDPPEHQRARSIVAGPFSPRRVQDFDQMLRECTHELIDGFIERGGTDVAKTVGEPIPGLFTALILGLPGEHGPQLHDWTHAMTHEFVSSPETAAPKIVAFYEYFAKVIEDRRANPGTDLLSRIVHSQVGGESLNDEELRGFCAALLIGGIDNTTMLIATMLWRLAWDHELRHFLRARKETIPTAVDEFLRFYSPGTGGRLVRREIEIGGVRMQPGEQVILISPVTNRDPAVFADPDVFMPERAPNPHLALAIGIHRCLGAHVIKVEAQAVLEEFLERIPDFTLDTRAAPRWNTGQVAGMVSVPIVFPPGRRRSQSVSQRGVQAWLDHSAA